MIRLTVCSWILFLAVVSFYLTTQLIFLFIFYVICHCFSGQMGPCTVNNPTKTICKVNPEHCYNWALCELVSPLDVRTKD